MKFKRIEIVLFFIALCLFFIKAASFLDPDFGWSIQMGRAIILHGIPKTDLFSYTMPGYPYVDHEWLWDALITKLYPLFGMIGLAVISALLSVFALIFSATRVSFAGRRFVIIPLILGVSIMFSFVDIRAQIITWFLFSLLIYILDNQILFKKFRFFLPLFFLFWANLHGGFAAGIGALLIAFLAKVWKNRKFYVEDFLLFLVCLGATLINPYGFGLWREVWMLISDSSLRWEIAEWTPSIFVFSPTLWIFITISFIGVWHYRKNFKPNQLVWYAAFLVLGITGVKNIPLWLLIALPMSANCFFWFYQEASRVRNGEKRFNKAYKVLLGIVLLFVIPWIYFSISQAFQLTKEASYPKRAVEFLSAHPISGRMFSTYAWGGYLIWKLSKEKVFIDGRMPDWQRNVSIAGESDNAMKDYLAIMNGKIKFSSVAKKYNIKIVLLPIANKKNKASNLFNELKKESWKEVYQDQTSIIYEYF